jgi:26S proteasome regulatory subunit N10
MGDAGASAGGAGGSNFEFGVDPSMDPELAMVRMPISYERSS